MDMLDLVLRQSNGAIRITLKRTAAILGLEPQTLRNQLSLGTCAIEPVRDGRAIFFLAPDIADFLVKRKVSPQRRGRPTKASKFEHQY